MILRTSGIGVSIAFLREAQWGSRGREFDSRHSDQKIQRFHVRNRWIFFVCGLASFGFDHNKRLLEFLIFVNRAAKSRSLCRFPAR